MTSLVMIKNQGETWREAVMRYATKYGLDDECLAVYESQVDGGVPEQEAAFNALAEWDCLEVGEDLMEVED